MIGPICLGMTVVSVSLTPELLDQLDLFVRASGYSSRSEAMRMAVREVLSQFQLEHTQKGSVMATVTVIYETAQFDISTRLMEFRHDFDEKIFGNMHIHIGGSFCVEIFLVQGDHEDVLSFITRVRTVRGIREVKYTMTPLMDSSGK